MLGACVVIVVLSQIYIGAERDLDSGAVSHRDVHKGVVNKAVVLVRVVDVIVHAVNNYLAVNELRDVALSGQRSDWRGGDGFLLVRNLDAVVGGHIFKCVFSVSSELTPHAVHIDVVKLIALIRCESYGDVLISSGNYLIVGPYICAHELRGAVDDFNFDGVSFRLGLFGEELDHAITIGVVSSADGIAAAYCLAVIVQVPAIISFGQCGQ